MVKPLNGERLFCGGQVLLLFVEASFLLLQCKASKLDVTEYRNKPEDEWPTVFLKNLRALSD